MSLLPMQSFEGVKLGTKPICPNFQTYCPNAPVSCKLQSTFNKLIQLFLLLASNHLLRNILFPL